MGKKAKARHRDKHKLANAAAADWGAGSFPRLDEGIPPGPPDVERDERQAATASPLSAALLAASLYGLGTLLQRQLGNQALGDGLTRARLSALALLVLGGPRTLGDLAAGEGVRPPTMTRLVQAMEADHLVVRERHPTDRRCVVIRATPAGEALLEEGRVARIVPLTKAISGLDRDDRNVLDRATTLLDRLLREAAPVGASGEGGKARGRADV